MAAGEFWLKPSTGEWYRSNATELGVVAYDDPNMVFSGTDWRRSPDWDSNNPSLFVYN